jgi:serine/threonine-protein kinase
MGVVYRAQNVVTGKNVAIKWMHPHVGVRGESVSRLLREAQAASRIDHPNIVDVYDIVQDAETLFMVMELLEGETLRAYLERPKPATISELLTLLLPALDGVACAHESGVIHRDLKPDNLFLARGRDGKVTAKVLDFGVAKVATERGLTLTETGMAMGTPLYMSIEQLRGDRDIDFRTDVYAFGAMFYEAVVGETPFNATTLPELVFKVATGAYVPVKQRRQDLPTPLARVIDWALAREREQRLPDLRALIRELEPFARDRGLSAQMTNPDAAPPRIAVRVPRAAAASSAASDDGAVIPASQQPAAVRPASAQPIAEAGSGRGVDPDTLKARVVATQRTPAKHSSLVWTVGVAAAALGLGVIGWLKLQPFEAGAAVTGPSAATAIAPPATAAAMAAPVSAPPAAHAASELAQRAAAQAAAPQPAPAPAAATMDTPTTAAAALVSPGLEAAASAMKLDGKEPAPAAAAATPAAISIVQPDAPAMRRKRAPPAPLAKTAAAPATKAAARRPQAQGDVQPAAEVRSAAQVLAF